MRLERRVTLVTGASGFIGTHLCRRLLEEGAEVHAISRRHHENANTSCRWWQADVGDQVAVDGIFRQTKPDTIFHLAGAVTGRRDLELVLPYQLNKSG